jgi:phosphopantothenoylcysteine decarboxylase/phosphopantothenate--cysteine ligase
MGSLLKYKRIVLGVCGGIAAYKAVELLRLLMREGAAVQVVMSANAGRFVTPLTFQALSGKPVYHDVFDAESSAAMEHIRTAENADLLIVAPATANSIAKMANGLADDALSTLFITHAGPVIVAPAMNDKMFANLVVQENIQKLKDRRVRIIEPEHGELACGVVGQGRLAEPARLLAEVLRYFQDRADLAGLRFLVTAGPTREPLDPVRFISNPSSGKMGYAIAEQARIRGAEVKLISGPTALDAPQYVQMFPCMQADEMCSLVLSHLPDCDVLVMTAAVGDFAPEKVQKEKIKKRGEEPLILKLHQTKDILQEVAKNKKHQFVVGFAAESESVIASAIEKLKKKRLDLIVANDISAPGIGFQSDSNQVAIIKSEQDIERLPLLSKQEVANILLDRIRDSLKKQP